MDKLGLNEEARTAITAAIIAHETQIGSKQQQSNNSKNSEGASSIIVVDGNSTPVENPNHPWCPNMIITMDAVRELLRCRWEGLEVMENQVLFDLWNKK